MILFRIDVVDMFVVAAKRFNITRLHQLKKQYKKKWEDIKVHLKSRKEWRKIEMTIYVIDTAPPELDF